MPTPPPTPSEISTAELAAARAVARRAGRTVFAVRAPRATETAAHPPDAARAEGAATARRLSFDRPDDPRDLAYSVDRGGAVRFGPGARPPAPLAGRALVRDVARIAPGELAAARDYALLTGRTVFVAEVGDDPEASVLHFEPPLDGTLRYAVRVDGDVLVGPSAAAEPAAAIRDGGWTARVSARLRQLRRLRERAAELARLAVVRAPDWARVERLIPPEARADLHPAAWIGARGADAARALLDAADRDVDRLRRDAGALVEPS